MSQAFRDIARFKHFTESLFKYLLNVIQNWETDVLQFYLMVPFFLLAVMVERD